jgi:hypothetical protein
MCSQTPNLVSRSSATRGSRILDQCNVYLPATYDENDQDTKYDILYLLHGVGGKRYEWLHGSGTSGGNIICNIFDHLIANGEIHRGDSGVIEAVRWSCMERRVSAIGEILGC